MKAILLVMFLSLLSFGVSAGAMLKVAPSEAVLLPSDGSVGARVAMKFDLSGVAWGSGRQIITANLDWSIAGIDQDAPSSFNVKAITRAWSKETAESGVSAVQCASEPSDHWTLEALDYERIGGFLRLRIPDLVRSWLENSASNQGVLVEFERGTPTNLKAQLANAKLVIHYVVVPEEQ